MIVQSKIIRYDFGMVFLKSFFVGTTKKCDAIVVTHDVRLAILESKIKQGLIHLTLPQVGAGWAVVESIPEIVEDLKTLLTQFKGEKGAGKNKAKESVPSSPQLQGALLGSNLTLSLSAGNLLLQPTSEIYLFDFSETGKRREFSVQILGEGAEEKPQQGNQPRR